MKIKKEGKADVLKYSKQALLSSSSVEGNRDVLSVVLEDDKEYTMEEVKKLLAQFNGKELN
ncbi:hypothetical protein [Filifactor villosus]|uniref:Uncharacterized protein n=1 Tax=Filifactor villosus TaxID=29374 RepID=A0ABV9QMW8_9FIRM